MRPDAARARELFIYWRCERTSADAALSALATVQQDLTVEFPGLEARRYLRLEDTQAHATVMETYADPVQGLDTAVEARLVELGTSRLGRWCMGPRHVEVFERQGR